MDSRRFEIESDLKEIDRLLGMSSRNYVKEVLINQRLKLSEELTSLPDSEGSPSSLLENIVWKAIDRFAWEQTNEDVKVYVTSLGDLKSHPKENIIVEHTANSVTVSIKEFNGNNYRLKFAKLSKNISSARITAKSNGFSLTLKKKEKNHWDALVPKAVPKKEEEEKEENDGEHKDPQDGLMNMMKELYESGDDDMKKTIAEAWTKAKDKETN